jgi:hypothetical protein
MEGIPYNAIIDMPSPQIRETVLFYGRTSNSENVMEGKPHVLFGDTHEVVCYMRWFVGWLIVWLVW